jgi:hypothetical protein
MFLEEGLYLELIIASIFLKSGSNSSVAPKLFLSGFYRYHLLFSLAVRIIFASLCTISVLINPINSSNGKLELLLSKSLKEIVSRSKSI